MILFITNNYCLSNKYALNAVKVNLKMKKVFVLNYFYSKKKNNFAFKCLEKTNDVEIYGF